MPDEVKLETGARPIDPIESKETKNPDNDLARALKKARAGFSTSSSYKWIALAIAIAVAILGWNYYSASKRAATAALWLQYNSIATPTDFRKFAEEHPDTTQGRLARLLLARALVGIEGLDLLGSVSAEERKKAIENIEEGGKIYIDIAPKLEGAVLQYEAYTQAARAQESLCATPTEKGSEQMRGSLEKALEYYRRAAAIAEKAGANKDGQKNKDSSALPLLLSAGQKADLLADIAGREKVLAEYRKIQDEMAKLQAPAQPVLPPLDKLPFEGQ